MCVVFTTYRMSISMLIHDFVGVFFFFKQKTAYEMRISDWSSDVCSSDLTTAVQGISMAKLFMIMTLAATSSSLLFNFSTNSNYEQIGRASCRERVCQYV